MMSQFLTINKLEGHMIVKQGVFVVKASKYNSLFTFSNPNTVVLPDQHPKDLFRYRYNKFFLTLTFVIFRRL